MLSAIDVYNGNNQRIPNRNLNFKGANIPNVKISNSIVESGASYLNQYVNSLYLQNQIINFSSLKNLRIPNLEIVYNRGVRGETLSASRNTRFLPIIKKYGVDTVIDLRSSDYTKNFKDKCENNGLKYFHIPIDKAQVSDREILDKLPEFFELIKQGKFYIACAQGLHRTDIALAIYYVFNPNEKVPLVMSGHTEKHITEMADINRRLNSLYRAMTPEDKERLEWPANYDKEFVRKKHILKTYSESR